MRSMGIKQGIAIDANQVFGAGRQGAHAQGVAQLKQNVQPAEQAVFKSLEAMMALQGQIFAEREHAAQTLYREARRNMLGLFLLCVALVITAAVAILATTVVVTTLVITVAVETPVAPAVLVKAKARDSQTCLSPQGELSGWRNRPPRMSAWLGIGGPRWSLSGRIAYRI